MPDTSTNRASNHSSSTLKRKKKHYNFLKYDYAILLLKEKKGDFVGGLLLRSSPALFSYSFFFLLFKNKE